MLNMDDGAYSALHTEKAYSLDIRPFKHKDAEDLKQQIEDTVRDTQAVIVKAYPDRIIMSQNQYDLLSGPQFMQIGEVGQEFWLYRTPFNIMEVEVK